jgi:repressor LexA
MCMSNSPKPLTAKEKMILEFIENQLVETGVVPSYQEIKDHFGFASFNSIQNYLKQLASKGYVSVAANQKRAIQVLQPSSAAQNNLVGLKEKLVQKKLKKISQETPRERLLQASREEVLSLPLLGQVAAGAPIEHFEYNEFIDVPPSLVRNKTKTFALKVKGQSMIEDGILDGDFILVQKQSTAANGEIVVATVDNESTVKRIYAKEQRFELRPANSSMQSMWYPIDQVQIQGVVVGLLRKF